MIPSIQRSIWQEVIAKIDWDEEPYICLALRGVMSNHALSDYEVELGRLLGYKPHDARPMQAWWTRDEMGKQARLRVCRRLLNDLAPTTADRRRSVWDAPVQDAIARETPR